MRALLLFVLVVVLVGGGLKLGGVELPLIDYPIGPTGIDGAGPGMPDVQIEPPGFNDLGAP
jgi:hypothetical protein